jgi:hypothetical protein
LDIPTSSAVAYPVLTPSTGALGSAPVDDRTVAFFLARARYARYMPDLRPALAVDA